MKSDKKNPVYNANLGDAYAALGKSEDAILYYEKALKYNAEDKKAIYYSLATEFFKMKNNDAGVKAVEDFVNTDATDYETYILGYELLHQYGLNKTSSELLTKALDLKTRSGEELNYKGMINFYLGEYEQARYMYDRARESGYKEAALNVAMIDIYLENYSEALGAYNYYENNVGKTAYLYNQKCIVNTKLGNYDDAIADSKKALELCKEDEKRDILFNQIIAYEKACDYGTAYELVTSYMEKYPDDKDAQAEYDFLSTQNGSRKGM